MKLASVLVLLFSMAASASPANCNKEISGLKFKLAGFSAEQNSPLALAAGQALSILQDSRQRPFACTKIMGTPNWEYTIDTFGAKIRILVDGNSVIQSVNTTPKGPM